MSTAPAPRDNVATGNGPPVNPPGAEMIHLLVDRIRAIDHRDALTHLAHAQEASSVEATVALQLRDRFEKTIEWFHHSGHEREQTTLIFAASDVVVLITAHFATATFHRGEHRPKTASHFESLAQALLRILALQAPGIFAKLARFL